MWLNDATTFSIMTLRTTLSIMDLMAPPNIMDLIMTLSITIPSITMPSISVKYHFLISIY